MISRQVLRRIERTGELPAGWTIEVEDHPAFHAEDGPAVDTEIGTLVVRKAARRRSGFLPIGLLGLSAVLTGCTTTRTIETPLVERIPTSLLECRGRPVVGALDRQSDVARYVVDVDAAGEDCRRKLGAINQIVRQDDHPNE